jgi:hypothetical protein
MTGTSRRIPTGLDEVHILRLFKCAVKDDATMVDTIVERLYFTMKDLDATRAEDAVGLIVDRDAAAGSKFGELLDDLWPRRTISRAAFGHRPPVDRYWLQTNAGSGPRLHSLVGR